MYLFNELESHSTICHLLLTPNHLHMHRNHLHMNCLQAAHLYCIYYGTYDDMMTFPGSSCNASGVYGGQKSQKTLLLLFFCQYVSFFSAQKFQQVLSIVKKEKKKPANFTDVTSWGRKLAAETIPFIVFCMLLL